MWAYNICVVLPKKHQQYLGAPAPRGQVLYTLKDEEPSESNPYYKISVPKSSCKQLQKELPKDLELDELKQTLLGKLQELCYTRSLNLINKKDYSEAELHTKLLREGYKETAVDFALGKLKEHNFINDTRYAECYIRSKIALGWGRKKIEQQLYLKGVSFAQLEGYPESYFKPQDELETIMRLLERKRLPDKNPYQKLYAFFARKGFNSSVIHRALSIYFEELESK